MGDVEFQRGLNPEQMREAIFLLDHGADARNQSLQGGDLSPAEEVIPETVQSSATTATQNRQPAAEDPQQYKRHLSSAIGFYGLGIAAVGALTLLSWSESAPPPSPPPGSAQEQLPNQPPAPPTKSTTRTLAVAFPASEQGPGGSERRPSTQQVKASSPIAASNRDDDQVTAKIAGNSDRAISDATPSAAIPAIAARQARWHEWASQKPGPAWWHARAVRLAAANKRFWRRHWQARAEIHGDYCSFLCLLWRAQHSVVYEPPRNVTQ
jgi:hypothetical protein